MNLEKAEQFLCSLKFNIGGFDLKQIKRLAELTQLRPEKLRVVHVAGTNGKCSTTRFISWILREQGYKVGSYYSPHMLKITERINIDNRNISEKEFIKLFKWFLPFVEKMKKKPSYFELLTAMAIKHFSEKKVDWVVAEVGLGGRLDATNILKGRICVFTSISLEHTEFLGKTVKEIAGEKAAIIKNNSIVVVNSKNRGIGAIKKNVKEKNGRLIVPEFKGIESRNTGNVFDLLSPKKIRKLKTPLIGNFQIENAALACAAAIAAGAKEKAIRQGLSKAECPGRMHLVGKNPLVLLDSAHNPNAMKRLMENLGLFEYERLIVVFGALSDKDVPGIMEKMEYDVLIAAAPKTKRALPAEKINEISGGNAVVSESIAAAIATAKKTAGKNDLMLICGSNYVVAEAMECLKIKE